MADAITLPENLADLLSDPQRIRDAMALLNGLAKLQVQLTVASAAINLKTPNRLIAGDPPNLILPIPLMLDAPIANSNGTAANINTQFCLLLQKLRTTGQLPT
jgi:hypothetical protein